MSESKGKYNLKAARAKAKKKTTKTTKQNDPIVTFTMNAKKSHRRWWAAQAKLQDTTMTKVATEALIKAFGLPPENP